jgi:hypothetical protein
MIAQARKRPKKGSEHVLLQEQIRGEKKLSAYVHIVEEDCAVIVPHGLNSANLKCLIPQFIYRLTQNFVRAFFEPRVCNIGWIGAREKAAIHAESFNVRCLVVREQRNSAIDLPVGRLPVVKPASRSKQDKHHNHDDHNIVWPAPALIRP